MYTGLVPPGERFSFLESLLLKLLKPTNLQIYHIEVAIYRGKKIFFFFFLFFSFFSFMNYCQFSLSVLYLTTHLIYIVTTWYFLILDDNGLNPVWKDKNSCVATFDITCPDLALVRFVVYDEDIFGDPKFLGQATFPVPCLRSGYRSVPLKNGFSEEIDMAALLIHIEKRNPRVIDIYAWNIDVFW